MLEEEILPLLDRPFAFFGYSLGATVAFELALRLEQKHRKAPRHVMAAARQPPHLQSRGGRRSTSCRTTRSWKPCVISKARRPRCSTIPSCCSS